MTPIKDVADLLLADPEHFRANVEQMGAAAIPSSEWPAQHPVPPRPSLVDTAEGADVDPPLFDSARDRVSVAEIDEPPPPRTFIVAGMLPQDAGTLIGPGGGGKTSIALWEAIHIILGKRLYGREVLKPGGVIYVSQEDERAKLIWIASQLVSAMGLTRGERERIAEHLYIPDLGARRVRLVEADASGNLKPTSVADQLINAYASRQIAAVTLDPLIFWGPGERFINDGGGEVMLVGRRLAHSLDCCVQLVGHTSIVTARLKQDDQYAARGAAAISDNGRFGRNLWTFADSDRERFGEPPTAVTEDDVARKRVLVLTQPKLSDGPPVTEAVWVLRHGWEFRHVPNEHRDPEQMMRDDVTRLQDFLCSKDQRDRCHTKKTLDDGHRAIGLSRARVREVLAAGEASGWIVQVEIPRGHPFRKGSRTHRFTAGVKP